MGKTKEELIAELAELRLRNAGLKQTENVIKQAELASRHASQYAENIVETVCQPLVVLDSDLKVISANQSFYDTFKVTLKESIGRLIYDLGNSQWDIPRLRTLLQDILPKDRKFDRFEVDHVFSTIGHRIMLLNARRILPEGTASDLVLLAIEDITERKRLENELKASEERLRRLFQTAKEAGEYAENIVETVREPLLVLDSDLKVISANQSFYDTFKVTPKESIGKLIYDLGNSQWDIPRLRTLLQDILPKDRKFDKFEVDHVFSTIGHRIIMLNARRIIREGTGSELVLLAMEDVTERKRLENELKDSEDRFRRLFETAKDGLLLIDKQTGTIVNVNPAMMRLLGYSSEECIGKKLRDIGILKNIQDFMETIQAVIEFGFINYDDVPVETKQGDSVDAEIYFVDRARFIQCNVRDITERKKSVEELKLFRNLIDHANDAIFVIDPETGRFLDVNAKACSSLGYERPALLRMSILDIQAGMQDTSAWKERADEVRNKGSIVLESRQLRKDGTGLPVEVNVSYVSLEKTGYLVAVARDITERKEAERTLGESTEKYKDLFDSTLDGIYQIDEDGIISLMNTAGAKIFGYESRDEMIGHNGLVCWRDSRDKDAFRAELKKKKSVSTYYMKLKNKKGEPIDIETSSAIIEDAEGNFLGIKGILRDVTARKRADEKIQRQIHKLSALRAIDLAINSSFDLRVTLKVFVDQVMTQLNADAANILLLNPHTRILEYAASQGFRTNALRHSRLRLGEGYAGVAALENRIVHIPDLQGENGGFKRSGTALEGEDFIAYYGVPLVAKGHVKGVLEIFNRSALEPDDEWFEFLDGLSLQAAIAIDNNSLFYDLERSNTDLMLAYDSTLEGWSHALDYRDKETEGHSRRVTGIQLKMSRKMAMNEEELVHVRRGALLHDIGKMGIPDSILLKAGKLTSEEWDIMRQHPVYAFELLYPIVYLRPSLDIPYCHHEKWDGTGYPRGLKGEQIPLAARIFTVVDVWDALRSDRPYRTAWNDEKTKEYILSLSGIQFDPGVVEVFSKMTPQDLENTPA